MTSLPGQLHFCSVTGRCRLKSHFWYWMVWDVLQLYSLLPWKYRDGTSNEATAAFTNR